LGKLRTPSSLPSGSVVGLSVENPRLYFPPPKASTIGKFPGNFFANCKIGIYKEEKVNGVEQTLLENSRWNPLVAQSPIWDDDHRASVINLGKKFKSKEDIPVITRNAAFFLLYRFIFY
jgi:hypothetical protein